MTTHSVVIRNIGLIDYEQCFRLMKSAINSGQPQRQHEIWMVEHPSVFTQGQAGKPEHLLKQSNIPCVQADRGGQITYHGPGQLVCYFLFDLKRLNLNVKQLVNKTTTSVIDLLLPLGIQAIEDDHNPGVYVNNKKIASLGFRVRKYMSYHGVAINHTMDLQPFQLINPCGRQQKITQISLFSGCAQLTKHELQLSYIRQIAKTFAFDSVIVTGLWPAEIHRG